MNWTEAFETLKNYDIPATEARLTLRKAKVLNEAKCGQNGDITVVRTGSAQYNVYIK